MESVHPKAKLPEVVRRRNWPYHIRTLLLCVGIVFSLGSGAVAQSETETDQLADFAKSLPREILQSIVRNQQGFLSEPSSSLLDISPDGIVTPETFELVLNRRIARIRASEIMQVLQYDLNGDGDLTAEEVIAVTPFLRANERNPLPLKVLQGDINKDGGLPMAELLSYSNARATEGFGRRNTVNPMVFDYNGDGRVNLAEAASVIMLVDPSYLQN